MDGLDPSVDWSRAVYSPEIGVWAVVGIPSSPDTYAVSAYSKDGIKWTMNPPSTGGLPVQFGPIMQMGWNSITYGNTGPIFVAVSNGYDNWQTSRDSYYLNGVQSPTTNYSSVATSDDGINWTTSANLFPYAIWVVTFNPMSGYFEAVGDIADEQRTLYNSYGAQSSDGVTWQMTDLPFASIVANDICTGDLGVVMAGYKDSAGSTNATSAFLPNYSSIWITDSNLPLNERITSVKYLQGAYYAIGSYGLYTSSDGMTWTNLNITDVNGHNMFATASYFDGLNDIEYLNGVFTLHIFNWPAGATGVFYYSNNPHGPYDFGRYGNITYDDFYIRLSCDSKKMIGTGASASGQTVPLYSDDGITWNYVA